MIWQKKKKISLLDLIGVDFIFFKSDSEDGIWPWDLLWGKAWGGGLTGDLAGITGGEGIFLTAWSSWQTFFLHYWKKKKKFHYNLEKRAFHFFTLF